jgi:acyl-CoA hydrolase
MEKREIKLEPKPVSESRVEMVELVLPNDTNPLGTILGGKVMHLMDIAAAIAAHRHCRRPVVTASMDRVDFWHPVRVGQLLILRASVNHAGRTSMEVGVSVHSEDLSSGYRLHTASAYATFVALGPDGRPAPVPPLLPETDEDRRRFGEAETRLARRLRERDARSARLKGEDQEGPTAKEPRPGLTGRAREGGRS